MADAPPQSQQPSALSQHTPPSTPPSPDTDAKLSRKREREVSLEPGASPAPSTDPDALREHRDTRTPAKKGRTIPLDPTEEEEDGGRSQSSSPPLGASPPHEIKMRVRQISQGVEDLNWKHSTAPTSSANNVEVEAVASAGGSDEGGNGAGDVVEGDQGAVSLEALPTLPGSVGEIARKIAFPPPTTPFADMQYPLGAENENENQQVEAIQSVDVETGDKGLKRKFLERGISHPPESEEASKAQSAEPLKRPRDDAEKDDNPREAKRPSPPPEQKTPKSPKKATAKLGGFMAYASATSPFAGVKGQNIFSRSPTTTRTPFASLSQPEPQSLGSSLAASASKSVLEAAGSSSSGASSPKPFGFDAYVSLSSPFSARTKLPTSSGSISKLERAKSPIRRGNTAHANAFSPYATSIQGFISPASKRARAVSPNNLSRTTLERNGSVTTFGSNGGGDSELEDEKDDDEQSTFGEKLRTSRDEEEDDKSDEEKKVVLTEQDIPTGEEDDETIHQVRGKLFTLAGNQWKERGTGTLKLNVRRFDGSRARLVMRKEAVYTLLLNVALVPGMRCSLAQDPRYLRFSSIEQGTPMHYNLKVASAKIAKELMEEINANIPN